MRQYFRLLLVSIILVSIAALVDWITAGGYLFGLWTGIFGVVSGLALVGIAVSLALGGFLFARVLDSENFGNALIRFSWLLAEVGLMTSALAYLFWLAAGRPWFS